MTAHPVIKSVLYTAIFNFMLILIAPTLVQPRMASFSNLTNVNSSVGNDTIYLDTNVAASFRLTFTDANGISGYTSNAVSVLGGNATFNSSNAQVSWTPSGADIGTHIFTISAEDNVTPDLW